MTILCDGCPVRCSNTKQGCCCLAFQKKTHDEIELEKKRIRKPHGGATFDGFIGFIFLCVALLVIGYWAYGEYRLFRILTGHW